jgi:hypothetical protein
MRLCRKDFLALNRGSSQGARFVHSHVYKPPVSGLQFSSLLQSGNGLGNPIDLASRFPGWKQREASMGAKRERGKGSQLTRIRCSVLNEGEAGGQC